MLTHSPARTVLGLCVLVAATLASGCASTIDARWDDDERASLNERFDGCEYAIEEEPEAVGWTCGVASYFVSRTDGSHDAILKSFEDIVTVEGVLNYTPTRHPQAAVAWEGDDLETTSVIFEPAEGTVLPTMVMLVLSHRRDGARYGYGCVYPGIISEAFVAQSTATCLQSAQALHAATR